MSTLKKITTVKNIEVKSIEYPVIYSYIYERESQDIKRLAGKFKNARVKKTSNAVVVKTITSFKLDKDGKIIPIYESSKPTVKKVVKAAVTSKRTARTSRTTPKTIQAKKNIKDNPNKED